MSYNNKTRNVRTFHPAHSVRSWNVRDDRTFHCAIIPVAYALTHGGNHMLYALMFRHVFYIMIGL